MANIEAKSKFSDDAIVRNFGVRYSNEISTIKSNLRLIPSISEAIRNTANSDITFKLTTKNGVVNDICLLAKDKSGKVLGQIKDASGKIVELPRIQEVAKNIDISNITTQQTLSNILDKLDNLCDAVDSIKQGQLFDRLGAIHGGTNVYIQALNVDDDVMRKHLLINSIGSLNEARSKLIFSLYEYEQFAERLAKAKFIPFLSGNKVTPEECSCKYEELQQITSGILNSTFYLCLAYYEVGEIKVIASIVEPVLHILQQKVFMYNKLAENVKYTPNMDNAWYKRPNEFRTSIESAVNEFLSRGETTLLLDD